MLKRVKNLGNLLLFLSVGLGIAIVMTTMASLSLNLSLLIGGIMSMLIFLMVDPTQPDKPHT